MGETHGCAMGELQKDGGGGNFPGETKAPQAWAQEGDGQGMAWGEQSAPSWALFTA